MRLHYLQHVPFEGLGYIEEWAEENNIVITCTRMFAGDKFPAQDEFDFLVIMGGPMSVNDEDVYPWLVDERFFVRETIEKNKPVLGICLGAQMIAKALGAKVYSNKHKEIGWFSVQNISDSHLSDILPSEYEVFQWHGETFDLPAGAIHIAASPVCKNQAFIYNSKVIGLQFHLESTTETINNLVENCDNELISAPYIQKPQDMLNQSGKIDGSNKIMNRILNLLLMKTL